MSVKDPTCWVIIPVHNRCSVTRACLLNLEATDNLGKARVCVVDDGSTDGTGEIISRCFPAVRVERGDGSLYWGGAIARGMEVAMREGAEVMVWLNDDCLPDEGAIEAIVERVRQTGGMCGSVCLDPTRAEVTYSGYNRAGLGKEVLAPEKGEVMEADLLSGNLVAVHRRVVEGIGVLDPSEFQHYFADAWYSWKAKLAGFTVELAGSATAVNETSNYFDTVGITRSAIDGWKDLFRKGRPICIAAHWRFRRRVWGFVGALPALRFIPVMVKYTFIAVRRGGIEAVLRRPHPAKGPTG
ncbi:glycosyltransferase family 2 protein [Haloferula sargassicola]|uniref:Glycosyltransferase 2-like domain-containing protein n=1 Tax=Haloferula sargassicola TaxID=490096 RepID=A0ABP9USJ1_9BACT